jgi:hypothetical protein
MTYINTVIETIWMKSFMTSPNETEHQMNDKIQRFQQFSISIMKTKIHFVARFNKIEFQSN